MRVKVKASEVGPFHSHAHSHFHFRRILILRGGALGDFIVTLPALAALRRHWPDARIELVGNAPAAALARSRGLLDAVHSQHEARWSMLYGTAPLPSDFAAWLAGFDLIVNYWPDPDRALQSRFPLRPDQTFLSAAAMPQLAPAAAHYCEPLRQLGIEAPEYHFPVAPLVAASVSEWSASSPPLADVRRHIAVHPGSGSPRKNWPVENWATLLPQLPAPISLILGEAELERWGAALRTGLGSSLHILLQPPLETLIGHLATCRLFLGHDSGISHLAAACGMPCVLLFGPTDPGMWAPPAPHVRVLQRGPDPASIPVAEVRAAALAALADRT